MTEQKLSVVPLSSESQKHTVYLCVFFSMDKYYFFIEEIDFNNNSKSILGYFFDSNKVPTKKILYTSLINRDKLNKYALIQFREFSYFSEHDACWIFVLNADITWITQLLDEDYDRFLNKFNQINLKPPELNPNLTEDQASNYRKQIINSCSIWENWDWEYLVEWLNDDLWWDSELTDYSKDWNYIYENINDPLDDLLNEYWWSKI